MAVQTMDGLVQSNPIDSGRIQLTAQFWARVIEVARTIEPELPSENASQTLDNSKIAELLPREKRLGADIDQAFSEAMKPFGDAESINTTNFHNLVAWVIQATSVQQRESWLELWKQLTESRGNETEAFETLARGWKEAHVLSSSASPIASHPDYQEIIAMGEEAIPLILNDLKRTPDHWFVALTEITGEDPVPEQHRGKLAEMAVEWLEWGEENGYI